MTHDPQKESILGDYLERLGATDATPATVGTLRRLHEGHIYRVPFENLSMSRPGAMDLAPAELAERIVVRRRGGICFETATLMAAALRSLGFRFQCSLANVLGDHPTPATHQVFVVEVQGERWLFDIGFGALGPRGLVRLADGEVHEHPALSTRVRAAVSAGSTRWEVSILEHASGAVDWKPIYSFVDAEATPADLRMAHYYTLHSPDAPLRRFTVASLPRPRGRISLRDSTLTVVDDGTTSVRTLPSTAAVQDVLQADFGLHASVDELTPAADVPVLTVPGWTGSGPEHWQTWLERTFRGLVRVEQENWNLVDREAWIESVDRAVSQSAAPPFLVGHSCGAVAVAQWLSRQSPGRVAGALLVSPADVEASSSPDEIRGQAPLPRAPLPARTHVVVSDDDPYLSLDRARELAQDWGSTLEVVPAAGHVATADGFGPWPRIAELIGQLSGHPLVRRDGAGS